MADPLMQSHLQGKNVCFTTEYIEATIGDNALNMVRIVFFEYIYRFGVIGIPYKSYLIPNMDIGISVFPNNFINLKRNINVYNCNIKSDSVLCYYIHDSQCGLSCFRRVYKKPMCFNVNTTFSQNIGITRSKFMNITPTCEWNSCTLNKDL